jgi:hypothetical protein
MNIRLVREDSARQFQGRDPARQFQGRSTPPPPQPPPKKLLPSKQDSLTEETFAQTLDGFEQVDARDLLEVRGGRVRYVIETGRDTKYRLGGYLLKVDPALRYLRLFNPYAKRTWSVQLATPGERVRLYYMAPATTDEAAMIRSLLQKMENGDVTLSRRAR